MSAGEQISSSLLAGALIEQGIQARSWMGWQVPILTDENYTSSQIIKIKTDEILKFISDRGVAVVAGFQGVSTKNRITTLGRGGSDLSAVAIAKFFDTDSCEIYTDVDGVLTTDPSIKEKAKKILNAAREHANQHKKKAEHELSNLKREIKKLKEEKKNLAETPKQ